VGNGISSQSHGGALVICLHQAQPRGRRLCITILNNCFVNVYKIFEIVKIRTRSKDQSVVEELTSYGTPFGPKFLFIN